MVEQSAASCAIILSAKQDARLSETVSYLKGQSDAIFRVLFQYELDKRGIVEGF